MSRTLVPKWKVGDLVKVLPTIKQTKGLDNFIGKVCTVTSSIVLSGIFKRPCVEYRLRRDGETKAFYEHELDPDFEPPAS